MRSDLSPETESPRATQCIQKRRTQGPPFQWFGDKRNRTAVALLRAFRHHPGYHPPYRYAVTCSLAVGRPPGAAPGPLRPIGLARPLRGSSTLRHVRPGAGRPMHRPSRLPQAFSPLQSLTRRCPHPAGAPLSRGSTPPQRHHFAASHHSRSCLLRVTLRPCRSRRLRRLAPAAISLVCFNQARSRGSSLQSFTLRRSVRLSTSLPLLRFTFPTSASPQAETLGDAGIHACARRQSASDPFASEASLQGFNPFAGLERPRTNLFVTRRPGSPGLSPPWGFPLFRPWSAVLPRSASASL